ncbi:predicted protein [Naegleria gruberi]|uniref:Predicted protein n=1 Tax=Naegleria gruberi TaxID=5762 RepID=D2V9Y0_NAEGR|nr:uncharacterized protein NAEGRDRAFT_60473 [Naegleria gruberi]EFC46330.1 predicted protein [Naegleria gruberi]|eukprot:XP_002679074.1 predicted protein [Naegleria gruberi strain NEG-M]
MQQPQQEITGDDQEQIMPNNTIYINNINEKIKVPTLKKQLYSMFGQFGEVLDVIASRYEKTRGQAFIVFKDVATATAAKKKLNGYVFHDKPMHINFAKSKSDATAKLDGNYEEYKAKRKVKQESSKQSRREENLVPSSVLFIENLPRDVEKSSELLETLFNNYDGYKKLRLVGEKGVAFVEYETIEQATSAREGLQSWKIKQQPMRISFKKM